MKKNKILYVITSLGLGGAEKLLLTYIKRLSPEKYSFHICCFRHKPDDLTAEISKYAEVTNLRISNKFNPVIILRLIKLINRYQPDIIHTHLFQPRFYTTVAHLFSKKSVLIAHKHNNVNIKKHNVFIFLEMLSIIFNQKVIAISQSVKQSLIKYEFVPEKKIDVIYNGIECHNFYENINKSKILNEKKIIIGTICRLERQKGLKYLLLAMKIILTKFPGAKLEIIGDGTLLNELQELSKKLGISNSVIFFGKFTDVKPFYKRMDVFVLPSLYEGFGIVLLEAMASGVPVIASNVDGIKEVVQDEINGILVLPKNPEAIAIALTRLIQNHQLYNQLVEEGLKRARVFDMHEHLMKLDNLYSSLLGAESY
jgi:glycosyltransferase involved in cell wall biosynthesis